MSSSRSAGLHWFRRDLRVAGNPALLANFKKNEGHVLGVFFFDSKFLSRSDFSHNRFAFFLKTLSALKEELNQLGGDLLVLDMQPVEGFTRLNNAIKKQNSSVSLVTWNRDYEPFARARDQAVQESLTRQNLTFENFRDHLLMEPDEVFKTQAGDYYKVYSPFAKKWFDLQQHDAIQNRIKALSKGISYLETRDSGGQSNIRFKIKWNELDLSKNDFQDQLHEFSEKNKKNVTIKIPEAGSLAAFRRLKEFKKSLNSYGDQRDIPSLDGTSQLSIFLKNGSITIGQIINFLDLTKESYKSTGGRLKYLKELVWREFYYHILYHVPRVENETFVEKYNGIKWENNLEYFEAWKKGKTGYPIVDAGMRQLNETGWMHNRVRMIVASFLTKDLLVTWQWGEQYFMEKLLDGDLALNNGGWQWSASTGVDAQPYFRIFNPKLQSERFDPDGIYIKKYVPELKDLDSKVIHEPGPINGYPAPLVSHRTQKEKALKLFRD